MIYQDNHITLYNKSCLDMSEVPDETIQCVVTSPPYWGLRKYPGEQELVWGGTEDCEHRWGEPETKSVNYVQGNPEFARPHREYKNFSTETNTCSICGAWKGSYGLEPTPEMYVQHTIEILREIRRVLRKDGVVFWNIGDSYMSSPSNQQGRGVNGSNAGSRGAFENIGRQKRTPTGSLKTKDLCLIPFRVAIAAQEPYQEFTIKELADRAWLAGIVDADGCISIHHYDRGAYHQFNPFISVGCSDEIMVNRCASITRCNGTRQVNRPAVDSRGINSNRPHYEWRLEGENAAKILEDIYPYLVVKEKQARVAHALWRNIQDTKETHKGKGHKTPDNVVRDRLALWELIKKCNQRESVEVDLPDVPQHIEPGWWVRSDIIWAKPNPMPESVTDRPANSHEYIFMLTKSAKYYWDADAVREDRQGDTHSRGSKRNPPADTNRGAYTDWTKYMKKDDDLVGRNLRSVWTFPTQPYPEAHFAVFPEKLPEICIKAATPEVGCCSKCGSPWVRVVDTHYHNDTTKSGRPAKGNNKPESVGETKTFASGERTRRIDTTIGWQPTCKCNAEKVPSIVLDPFAGSATTLAVAKRLGRHAIGFELSAEYCKLAQKRVEGITAPLPGLFV